MEETRSNQSRFGIPVLRQRSGYESAGELFFARRERQLLSGVLSEEGHGGHYVLFQPSRTFVRIVGERVLRLNDALDDFRHEAADHALFLDGDKLQAHYDELERCVDKARDRLVLLTEYCNKGFDGKMPEALGSLEDASGVPAAVVESSSDADEALEAARQRHVKAGILTDTGWKEGWVALRPCPFYGRFVGEIILTLNDALRRMEGRTWYHIVGGDSDELLRQYYQELGSGMCALRQDLEAIIEFCQRKVV